jgi:hypothetical protein
LVSADGAVADTLPNLLSWLWAGDYTSGIVFILLGIVGAAVTVYLTLEGYLPNINKSARMLELEVEMTEVKEQSKQVRNKLNDKINEQNAAQNQFENRDIDQVTFNTRFYALEKQINNLRYDITNLDKILNNKQNEYNIAARSLQRTSILFYIPIGAAFAALIAEDPLEALGIGAGWTAFISLTQLNKKDNEGKKHRDKESDKIQERNSELEKIISDYDKKQKPIMELQKENEELKKAVADMAIKLKEKGVKQI